MSTTHRKALELVRVLDLSRVLAGPWASQMLADMGAEVIKIERPGKGDDSRTFGPTFVKDKDGRDTRESAMYVSANRNKKSITVNIAKPEGQQLIRDLAAQSDVLLENYKVGDLARYGLDYASIRAVNPRIIYCSVTGFGQTGPYSHRLGYDSIFQAMGGLMSVNGEPDGVPGGGPMKVGPSITDVITGLYASNAIIGALYHRDADNGVGQYIDMALLDSVLAALSHYTADYLISGVPPFRRGTEGNGGMPSQMFHCADSPIMLVAGNDGQFKRLCEVLQHPELARDERFANNINRVKNRNEMTPILAGLMRQWKQQDLLAALDKADVPAGPIYNLQEAFNDPQVKQRGLEIEVPHPLSGSIKLSANPIRYSETPIDSYAAPPLLGAHTDAVLRDLLKLDETRIAGLRAEGII